MMSQPNDFIFVATCSKGVEELVEEEVIAFGGKDVGAATGVVGWCGSLASAYRACLWSRFSSRILLEIGSFRVDGTDSLYENCKKMPWNNHLNASISFAVSSTIADDSIIHHSHFAALRVKDAIVDQFTEKGDERPQVKKDKPAVRVTLHIDGEKAVVYIDLSGESLHRRGYRDSSGIAPLKETLAAAIVAFSGWGGSVSPNTVLIDPMCGSATLLIEAALMYGDSAPGLSRRYYGFRGWLGHDERLWSQLVDEAVERENQGFSKKWPTLLGYDSDPVMVAVARKNLENAGLDDKIQVKCSDIAHLKSPSHHGYIVSNLPYGERLSEKEEVKHLYRGVGRILHDSFTGWNTALFISQPDLADTFGLTWRKSHKLYNGPILCRLFIGHIQRQEENTFQWSLSDYSNGDGADFINRLRKNFKKTYRWSQKNNVHCFRIYDRDLPEYNVAIDIYGKWLLVQEFLAPTSIEIDVAKKRFFLILHHLRELFNVRRDRVFIKQRSRQRGKEQYQKKQSSVRYYEVREDDCFFLVNFTNYLDTGIFLDHRPVRKKIAQKAQGKRFLNLFGYTATATVRAVKAGASLATTVDLSLNYLKWAKKNFALNGLSLQNNEIVHQECMSWLRENTKKYDLILMDPPTFSNTKKKNRVFDVQKDHAQLIILAMRHLDTGGLLLFSTNFRKFRLDTEIQERFVVSDISKETIPFDFQRNSSIHRCWEIRAK